MDSIVIYLKKYYVCGWSHSLSLLNAAKKDFRQNAALRNDYSYSSQTWFECCLVFSNNKSKLKVLIVIIIAASECKG